MNHLQKQSANMEELAKVLEPLIRRIIREELTRMVKKEPDMFSLDPEMPLYNGAVGTLDVVHLTNVGLGTNSILVNVSSGGQSVDSALVCLSKGDEDYQYAPTNALGNAIIDFTTESPGSISVVVHLRQTDAIYGAQPNSNQCSCNNTFGGGSHHETNPR